MTVDFDAATNPKKEAPPPAPVPEIVEVDPTALNLEPIRTALSEWDTPIAEMAKQAEALVVDSEATNLKAVEMAGQVKRLDKKLELARKDYTGPANEYVKAINGTVKPRQALLREIENGLKGKISTHQAAVLLEHRKAEEAARKAQKKLQAKLDADAKKAGVEAVKVDEVVVAAADPVTRTESGTATQRKTWEFEVEDPGKVPPEYLMVDEKKVRAAVRNGVRNIPGVKIYQETKTQIRG